MPTNAPRAIPDPLFGEEICRTIRQKVGKLGLDFGDEPVWTDAAFVPRTDHATGEVSLVGTWSGKARYGTVTLFPDGRVFAEYQVLLPLPDQPGRYVEAMQVWGEAGRLKGDAVIVAFDPA